MKDAAATRLEWTQTPEGRRVAHVVLDLPGKSANLLSTSVLGEIGRRLDEAEADPQAAGLVIESAKPGVFLAGADLAEFVAGLDRPREEIVAVARRGQSLLGRLSETPFPTVAAIDGVCVGGGLELALWCDRRVATTGPKTQLGFPEVKLGLMPGWGGTALATRRIGLGSAVELVTSGESIDTREASRLGLVDDVVADSSRLLDAALALIDDAHRAAPPPARRGVSNEHTPLFLRDRARLAAPSPFSETELGMLGASASAVIQQKTRGQYPAPMAALELLLSAASLPLSGALAAEAEAFAPLFGSPVNRALLNVFFLTDRAKKPSDAERYASAIDAVAVVGAGIMGQGIAAAAARRGVRVTLADNRPEALAAAVPAVVREAAYDKRSRGPSVELAVGAAALVGAAIVGEDAPAMPGVGLAVEAVVEDENVKHRVLAAVEKSLDADAVLATNTSTIPIGRLAEGLARPERFVGLHFFNPVRRMQLVEVIRGPRSSDEAVARATAFARKLGKTPVLVGDAPGFLVNRLLLPYMNEAALLVGEGVSIQAIDRAAKAFGMPMGPLELHDVVGLDTCLGAGRVMHSAMADRLDPAPAVERLVAAGRLGQKRGGGFYDWRQTKPDRPPEGRPSPEGESIGRGGAEPAPLRPAPSDLEARLFLPMLVEATRTLEAGVARGPRDIDLAMILGAGFPPFRGGLFFWADSIGAAAIVERLDSLRPLGKRFEPTESLLVAARRGTKFYDEHSAPGGRVTP